MSGTKTHYTPAELAGLPGLPGTVKGTIQKADREAWPSQPRAGRGGGREYPVSCLPQITREHLAGQTIANLPAVKPQAAIVKHEAAPLQDAQTLKKWQRDVMDARLVFMRLIEQAAPAIGVGKAIATILQQATDGDLPEHIQALVHIANKRSGSDETGNRTLAERTMYRWWSAWLESGKKSVSLAPKSIDKNELPAWSEYFLQCYRVPQKISVAHAIEEMRKILPAGILPPTESQAYRFIEKYSKLDIQRGRKSSKDLLSQRSYIQRDTSKFYPGDICLCDGHSFKAYVAHPAHGRPFHPEVCAVIDAVTRTVIGWSAGLAESAQTVADAIRHAVTTHEGKPEGCIPALFYTDQGSGNKADVNANELTGIYARLGITFKTGIPGRSQARGRIERPQASLWIRAAQKLPTYTGKGMDGSVQRKVYLTLDKDVRESKKTGNPVNSKLLISWADFLDMCQDEINSYNRRPHSALPKIIDRETGRKRHMCPLEMWSKFLGEGWEPVLPDPAELELLFRPQVQCMTRRGLVTVYGNSYHHKDLEHYHGRQVHVGYDIHDASRVWVRDTTERLICIATFEGNKRDFYAVPVVEQAVENRRERRLKTALNRVEEINAEAEGIKRQLAPESIEITPEALATSERVLQLVEKRKERKLVGTVWERYEDICDREKAGDVSAYELQWKADYEAFGTTGKKTGLYRDDEYCIGEFEGNGVINGA